MQFEIDFILLVTNIMESAENDLKCKTSDVHIRRGGILAWWIYHYESVLLLKEQGGSNFAMMGGDSYLTWSLGSCSYTFERFDVPRKYLSSV